MAKIVIIGGGFGGVYAAKELLKRLDNKKDTVVLINQTNYFLFTPMLHEIATGGISLQHIAEPIRKEIRNKNFNFVEDKVKTIDFNKKMIVVEKSRQISYDYLVIAVGGKTNFFNIPGAEQFCYQLKDLHQAFDIRNKIIEQIETAERDGNLDHNLSFAIIGGGPTGVEIAGEIVEFADQIKENCPNIKEKTTEIYLVQRNSRLLPMLHEKCSEKVTKELNRKGVTVLTNCSVTRVFKDGFEIIETNQRDAKKSKKRIILAAMVIWTSGVVSNQVAITPKLPDKEGSIEIDTYLRVKGRKKEFAIGDCAYCIDGNGNKVPWLAQAAIKQAKTCAENIVNDINNKPLKKFVFKSSGLLVSVGRRYAVAEMGSLRFKGFFAWWLWRTIYLSKLLGIENKIRVAYEWTLDLFFKRDTTKI